MKLKALLLALGVAGAAAAFGLTDAGRSDTGTTTATGTTVTTTTTTTTGGDCKRFWVAGPIASVGTTSFSVTPVKERHSSAPAGSAVTVGITPDTRVFWQGKGTLAGPGVGDLARVYGKQCGQTATARLVLIRPAPLSDSGRHAGERGTKGDSKPAEHHH
jgi:hypothetical protein